MCVIIVEKPTSFPGRVSYDWTRVVLFCCIFRLSTLFYLYLVFACLFSCTALFVSISQVIGCEDRLRNDLLCVGWGVIKLYSITITKPCSYEELPVLSSDVLSWVFTRVMAEDRRRSGGSASCASQCLPRVYWPYQWETLAVNWAVQPTWMLTWLHMASRRQKKWAPV